MNIHYFIRKVSFGLRCIYIRYFTRIVPFIYYRRVIMLKDNEKLNTAPTMLLLQ